MRYSILIVEDEKCISELIANRLDAHLYDVDTAIDGKEAVYKITQKEYDLITLDIMLPNTDGFELAKLLRKKSFQTLVIMVSALDQEEVKLRGYDLGIDDYMTKPFSPKELATKIKTLLKRRTELLRADTQAHSALLLDSNAKELFVNGSKMGCTPSEYIIIETLMTNKNRVFSRLELSSILYESGLGDMDERSIDSHIYHIRKKIRVYFNKEVVKTVRGMGYKLYED
jgi:DNA-binding response OmpR family regulator